MLAIVTIATAIFLIAIGAILRYAINVNTDVINIQTVGLILMIAGGAGLALSLLYELVQQGGGLRTGTTTPRREAGTTTPPAASRAPRRSTEAGGLSLKERDR